MTIAASNDDRACQWARHPPSITGVASHCLLAGGHADVADGAVLAALGCVCLASDRPNKSSVAAVRVGDPAVASTTARNELLAAGASAASTIDSRCIDCA